MQNASQAAERIQESQEVRRIATKFNERALLPAAVLKEVRNGGVVETSDGVRARIIFLCGYNNCTEWVEQDLEDACRSIYGHSFKKVERVWNERLPMTLDGYWHKVRMERI